MTRHQLASAAALSAALVLAACGAQDETDPAADSVAEPEDGRTDVNEPQTRLVVTTEGGASVLDAGSGEVLGTFSTRARPVAVVAGDGRHVLCVLPAFDIPEDWQEPRPTLTVVGHTAYVADPATMTVLAVDLTSGTAVDTFAVDGVPTAIVAVPTPSH